MSRRNRIILLIFLGALAVSFVEVRQYIEKRRWQYSHDISKALSGARSVRLVEFQRDFSSEHEFVFQRILASPAQISALRAATVEAGPTDNLVTLCAFDPHHRVEIVRADGSEFRLEVCFLCNGFAILGNGSRRGGDRLPSLVRSRLWKFFTDAGMPPLSSAAYDKMVEEHPDFPSAKAGFRR